MGLETILRGLLIGFSIAAPVGPIGVLCIRRTLADGRVTGLAVGLGATAAAAVYGAIAGFGLTAVSSLLVRQQGLLRLVGGLFLCYLGVRTFMASPARDAARVRGAGLGIASAGSWREATVLVAGVFLGSALWWLMLSGAVSALRSRVDLRALRWINRVSGLVLLAFGIAALAWR